MSLSDSSHGFYQTVVPSETFADIFSMAVEGSALHFPPDFTETHWAISRVCRRWRNIALGEIRLWNNIFVTSAEISRAQNIIDFAQRTMASRGLLSMHIEGADSPFSVLSINTLVIPHLPRLRSLSLRLQSPGFTLLFQQPAEAFVSLESLQLSLGIGVVDDVIVEASKSSLMFNMARSLLILELRCSASFATDRLSLNMLNLPIPWHQLKIVDVRIGALSRSSVYSILLQCPNVSSFTTTVDSLSSDPKSVQALTLPNLQILSLLEYTCRTLRYLILPTLTELRIQGLYAESACEEIANMVVRSNCKISIFEGDGRVSVSTAEMNALMSSMPFAQEFRGIGLFVEGSTLRMIGHGGLLPLAEVLHCDLDDPGAFVDALEMRIKLAATGQTGQPSAFCCAIGQCTECDEREMDAAVARLEGIVGYNYSLRWKPRPTRPLF